MHKIHRSDNTQGEIVAALRKACVSVWVIGRPVDLLTYYRGRWLPLEIKTRSKLRMDQEAQTKLLATYAVPVVRSAQEALDAVMR